MSQPESIRNPLRKDGSAETRRALKRVGIRPRARLSWAVERFTATPLTQLNAQEQRALRIELAMLLRGPDVAELRLPSAPATAAAQARVAEILRNFVTSGRALIADRGRYWIERPGRLVFEPLAASSVPVPVDSWTVRAALELGRLLGEAGDRVRICTAPKRTARGPAEPCGRLFVGRPNRLYCSTPCGNRATTYRARHGERREEIYRGRRIELASDEVPESDTERGATSSPRWRPVAWVDMPDAGVSIEGQRLQIRKTAADAEALRLARRYVDDAIDRESAQETRSSQRRTTR